MEQSERMKRKMKMRGGKEDCGRTYTKIRCANVVWFFLWFQFVGDFQIGDNVKGDREGWVDGKRSGCCSSSSSNRSGRGESGTEGTIGHGACSQFARFEVRGFLKKTKKRERGDRERRERKRK